MSRAPAFLTGEDPEYYDALGVATDAHQDQIAAAYRALMRRYHPDARGGEAAEDTAKRLNEAFSVLGHPDLRAQYDAVHGYPQVDEAPVQAPERPRPAQRGTQRPRRAPSAPEPEHGAPALMVLAVLIAAAAVLIMALLIALSREQRAEVSHRFEAGAER